MRSRKNHRRSAGLQCLSLYLATAGYCLAFAAPSLANDAAQIMSRAFAKTLSHAVRYEGSLVRFHPNGREHRRSKWRVERSGAPGAGHSKVRYLAPPELAGVTLLIHSQPGKDALQWLYTPATNRARPVRPEVRGRRFYASDFSFEDLQETDAQTTVFEFDGEESILGQPSWRIRGTPPESSPYDETVLWVSQRQGLIVQVDQYHDAIHIKRMNYRNYREKSGAWFARQVEVFNVQTGWRTVFLIEKSEVGVEFPSDTFDPASLEAH